MTAKELFVAALKLSPEERKAFVETACGPDQDLRNKVLDLLRAHQEIGSFLEKPAGGQTVDYSSAPKASTLEGLVIAGRYKLLQEIAEGGMGTVYMAEQIQPVKRIVAVKLIRTGMDSKRVLARFEAERQALALMDHPFIAKILDAGTAENGCPFFVMDLVKGIPLTDYCDQHQLSISQRLALFQQICSGVQHAHQKGIIHRDLKPTNILVENHDGKPVPRIIDFGLAKAMSGIKLSEQTLFTAFGTVTGTPLYMAPEQATFNAIDVDTRADIYALGVLLYELLAGSTPIERETLKKAAFDEVMKAIREQEPPTPSTRLSTSDALPSIAARRLTQPGKLGRTVAGDLDWIVMKALAKERNRRYDTAISMADDIQRFLNEEPVHAGPPTVRYRVGKFVRRNRSWLGVACLGLLVSFGFGYAVVQSTRAQMMAIEQHKRAQYAEMEARDASEKENQQRTKAELSGAESQALNAFLLETVIGSRYQELVYQGKIRDLPLSEALQKAEKKIPDNFKGQPLAEAKLRHYLGNGFVSLGKPIEGIKQFEKALELYRAAQGPSGPDTRTLMIGLGRAYSSQGLQVKAIETWKSYLDLHPEMSESLAQRSEVLDELGESLEESSRWEEALKVRQERVLLERELPPGDSNLAHALFHLGHCLNHLKQWAQAEAVLRESMNLYQSKGQPLDWFQFVVQGELGACLKGQKKYQEALPILEASYQELKKREGNNINLGPLADDGRANEVLRDLVEVFEKTGQKEKAAALRKNLKPVLSWEDALRELFETLGKKGESAKPGIPGTGEASGSQGSPKPKSR